MVVGHACANTRVPWVNEITARCERGTRHTDVFLSDPTDFSKLRPSLMDFALRDFFTGANRTSGVDIGEMISLLDNHPEMLEIIAATESSIETAADSKVCECIPAAKL